MSGASLPPPRGLCRTRDAAGAESWLWHERGRWFRPGLPSSGDLAAAARWLMQPAARRTSGRRAMATAGRDLCLPGRPGKVLAIGRNFAAHARELGNPVPDELVFFAKLPDLLAGPDEAIPLPGWLAGRVDPEAEVAVLLGREIREASAEEAAAAIAGYGLANDVTARDVQRRDKEAGRPWLRSKNLPGFGVLGPGWVPAAEIRPETLHLVGRVNGEIRQEAGLDLLQWPPAEALAALSRWMPLRAGDVVLLGTPAGVSPIGAGDHLEVEAAPLGRLSNPVVARAQ